jgi:DUF4097 and DUF4098 domain-containing protein YvlB
MAAAQETGGERVVVPARNTTHPRVVNVHTTHGSITVKPYNGKEVIVETRSARSGKSGSTSATVDGLKRVELPPRGLSVEEEDNVIEVRAGGSSEANLTITVPPDTSLHLRSSHGDVSAEGVTGEVEATNNNGEIRLTNISGTVVASTTNGSIKAVLDRVDPGKPLAFSSTNGNVDVTLPADFKANVKLRSLHGEIGSDFEIKFSGQPTQTSSGGKDGKFRVQFDRTIYGTINGGGTEASFSTLHGRILIRKK